MPFQNVRPEEWIPGPYRPAALLARSAAALTELGINFVRDIEDGLGEALLAGIQLPSQRRLVLVEYLQAPTPHRGQTHIEALYEPLEHTADTLDEFLAAMDLTTVDLLWTLSGLRFRRHAIWRQDDNGNRFFVSGHPSRSDALRAAKHFESMTHKQFYWIERTDGPDTGAELRASQQA